MVWVVFTERFKFTPQQDRRASIIYKPSDEPREVTKECAERAIERGAAKRSARPKKPAPTAALSSAVEAEKSDAETKADDAPASS